MIGDVMPTVATPQRNTLRCYMKIRLSEAITMAAVLKDIMTFRLFFDSEGYPFEARLELFPF